MPPRTARARLDDIDEAVAGILQTLAGVDFKTYAATWHLQRAVERGLEIISEASRSIPIDLKALAPTIAWPQIAAIGNLLRHEYQRVEPLIVWNIVEDHLAPLVDAVRVMTAAADRDDQG